MAIITARTSASNAALALLASLVDAATVLGIAAALAADATLGYLHDQSAAFVLGASASRGLGALGGDHLQGAAAFLAGRVRAADAALAVVAAFAVFGFIC